MCSFVACWLVLSFWVCFLVQNFCFLWLQAYSGCVTCFGVLYTSSAYCFGLFFHIDLWSRISYFNSY